MKLNVIWWRLSAPSIIEHTSTGKASNPPTRWRASTHTRKNTRQHTERGIDMPQHVAQIIRGQNSRRDAKRRAEMTSEQRIQAREISRGQQRAPRTRRAYSDWRARRPWRTSKPWEASATSTARDIPVFKAVKWKNQTAKSCCRRGKVVLAPSDDPPQELKQSFANSSVLVKIRSYNRIFAFMPIGASLTENAQTDKQLENAREGAFFFFFFYQQTLQTFSN